MGKKKKTKEQKIISDLRRKLSLKGGTPAGKPKVRSALHSSPAQPTATHAQNDYTYLAGDLKRVVFLTGLAILFQGVLYLALR